MTTKHKAFTSDTGILRVFDDTCGCHPRKSTEEIMQLTAAQCGCGVGLVSEVCRRTIAENSQQPRLFEHSQKARTPPAGGSNVLRPFWKRSRY